MPNIRTVELLTENGHTSVPSEVPVCSSYESCDNYPDGVRRGLRIGSFSWM